MGKTDYRSLMNRDYLGAWDVPESGELVLTIERAGKETVVGEGGSKEECLVIHYSDAAKPMVCNVTNANSIRKVANSPYIEDWKGVRVILYSTEVKYKGEMRDAIRIRDYAPKLPEKLVCADCGKEIVANGDYSAKSIAESSRGQFGRTLCFNCAKKAKADAEKKAKESDIL